MAGSHGGACSPHRGQEVETGLDAGVGTGLIYAEHWLTPANKATPPGHTSPQ